MREDLTAQDDLKALAELLVLYRANHRDHASRPLGLNREFTAALIERNEYGLALLPADHPAINADGELTDRWGSPYQFHPLSSDQVEIRSAGPDRQLYTGDDLIYSPMAPEERAEQFNP